MRLICVNCDCEMTVVCVETFLQGLCIIYALAVKIKLKMQIGRNNSISYERRNYQPNIKN